MRYGNSFASALLACSLTTPLLGLALAANAGPAGSPALAGEGLPNHVVVIDDRGEVPRTYVPIAPSYRYYDYPYYYSRGYYPIHIRPGFIYYGHPYGSYRSLHYRRNGSRCSHRHRRCAAHSSHGRKPARRRPSQHSGACACL